MTLMNEKMGAWKDKEINKDTFTERMYTKREALIRKTYENEFSNLEEDKKQKVLDVSLKKTYAGYSVALCGLVTLGLAVYYGVEITGSFDNLMNPSVALFESFKEVMLNTKGAVINIATLVVGTVFVLASKKAKRGYTDELKVRLMDKSINKGHVVNLIIKSIANSKRKAMNKIIAENPNYATEHEQKVNKIIHKGALKSKEEFAKEEYNSMEDEVRIK